MVPPMKNSKGREAPKAVGKNSFKEVPVKDLRWRCDPETLGFETTKDVKPAKEIIGQDRALRALRLGLDMRHFGFNIFVTGFSGTGRTTTIKRLLQEFVNRPAALTDKCYVHNFRNPDAPIMISLPAGKGSAFAGDMKELVEELVKNIPAVFESRRYEERKKSILEHFQARQRTVLKDFEKRVKEKQFELVQVQAGPVVRPEVSPVVNGQPVAIEQLRQMVEKGEFPEEQYKAILEVHAGLDAQMELVFREMRNIERKAKESFEELEEDIALPLVKESIDAIRARYDNVKLHAYLDDVQNDIMNNLSRFRKEEAQAQPSIFPKLSAPEEDEFIEYQVNVLVDNSATKGLPIIIETNPRYRNIFGTIERVLDRGGVWKTNFMQIKAGSLLQADGGYLVLNALDVLVEPGVWQDLKRTLRHSKVEIHTYEPLYGLGAGGLKPEAIDLSLKVVMIGDAYIYHLLYTLDDDFKKIFKVRADFDVEMPKNPDAVKEYSQFIRMICDDEKLKPFDKSAVAEIIEYGTRLAGRQAKLSTRFNLIADVLREANYWAEQEHGNVVSRQHVMKAIDERVARVNLVEEKIQEMITEGTIMIDTEGAKPGQVNGLSVYDLGEYTFGRPSRITAKTAMGRSGVINIEREAELSGKTHNKGVAILGGYLRGKFAQDKPLVMSASLCFEQSYSGVDGDSASSTEVYAILSSLANVPLRQDIAVTGSVNQNGEIQPIGGVNEKIEGFYAVCKAKGLTGTQGVIIPHQNITGLMLRQEVIDAVKEKKFHIYPVKTIDEGIEILTGLKAGKLRADGTFEPGTISDLVDKRLREFAARWKQLSEEAFPSSA
jgi:lon-related putative ATP-dependent protease